MIKNRKAREEELRERQLQEMAKGARERQEDISSWKVPLADNSAGLGGLPEAFMQGSPLGAE